jgi:hypothetical protein
LSSKWSFKSSVFLILKCLRAKTFRYIRW